jgi:PRTRC genetic system protein C
MSLTVEKTTREFKYNGVALQDPDPKLTVEAVRDFYANLYPEIVSAAIEGPVQKGSKLTYEFRKAVGTKGTQGTNGTTLRARLEAEAAGTVTQRRGHIVNEEQLACARPLAQACHILGWASNTLDKHDRIAPPAEALPPVF